MRLFLIVVTLAIAAATPAAAQDTRPAALPRADAHFVIGWQNLHPDQPQDSYDTWLNGIFYGGAGAGWFWTDHLKTQVDIGAGTKAHQYRSHQITIDGNPAYGSSRVAIRQQSVAIAQQYQFFRNQWFHPHFGAGVDLARETTTEEYQPTVVFDNVTHTSRTIVPAHTEGPDHRFLARGFGEIGFKAYMTRQAFFTSDMRIMFRSGIDEVLFRAGFGFDF
jgi:opacity protein-like surface antigen